MDANVAVRNYVPGPNSERAILLFESEAPLLAPDFMMAEVANAFRGMIKRDLLSTSLVTEALCHLQSRM
jgi:predicted nucleic acid-binding protein